MAARPNRLIFLFSAIGSHGVFVMLFPGILGIVSCLSGLFGLFGYIYYSGLGRMKCNGSQIISRADGAVRPLGSSRLEEEHSAPDLLPRSCGKDSRQPQ